MNATAVQCIDAIPKANGLDVRLINPRRGTKYSTNLYKWLTHREHDFRAWTSRVYRDHEGTLWIGMWTFPLQDDGDDMIPVDTALTKGELIGTKLMAVLCDRNAETMCYPGLDLTEIENFWSNYLRIGRCAIDVDHTIDFFDDRDRWSEGSGERTCNWCGARQTRDGTHQTVEPLDRETLGKLVREEWMAWAREQPDPKPSWLTSWDRLTEAEREVDRRIGERIYAFAKSKP